MYFLKNKYFFYTALVFPKTWKFDNDILLIQHPCPNMVIQPINFLYTYIVFLYIISTMIIDKIIRLSLFSFNLKVSWLMFSTIWTF